MTAALPGRAEAQQLRVVVVPDLTLADLSVLEDRGAVGLLVPDAGPRTSADRARAAIERGAVRNSVLGGLPEGRTLLEVETSAAIPRGPAIVLGLPRGGDQPNDRRYPIAVVGRGYSGLLTSPSTRIRGLVSAVDIAPTSLDADDALGSERAANPVANLVELDDRIRANRAAKPFVLLLSLALVVALAAFLPAALLPAFTAILLANLLTGTIGSTEAWPAAAVLAVLALAAIPLARTGLLVQSLLLVGVLGAYLVSMALDERWVALSPLGPTQNARFYGLSNLLATLLLVPALAGAVLLGRRFGLPAFAVVAALSLVAVGGSSFGADGGGVIVLFAGFAVLAYLTYGLERRLWIAAGAAAAVLIVALVIGGSSHVTDSLSDGPVRIADDLGRRLQLSWERATAGPGVAALVFGGITALAALASRERRALPLALLAAIGVSLLVNDSPNDVVIAGLACYLVVSSAPGFAAPASARSRQAPPAPSTGNARAAAP